MPFFSDFYCRFKKSTYICSGSMGKKALRTRHKRRLLTLHRYSPNFEHLETL